MVVIDVRAVFLGGSAGGFLGGSVRDRAAVWLARCQCGRVTYPSAPVASCIGAPAPGARRPALLWQVVGEVRWSFTRPWTWLAGLAVNLVLSVLWLLLVPLTGRRHSDWVIVVGTYFATFLLADVTTTNVVGPDVLRVRASLGRGVSLRRILLVKNLALLVIVGAPLLLATALLTVFSEASYRLVLTLPGVAFPVLTWFGVGNLVSVLLPVVVIPLRQRWRQRRHWRSTGRWLFHLAVPYALLYAVDPVGDLPGAIVHQVRLLPGTAETRGVALAVTGLALWTLGTTAALGVVRLRQLRI